MKKNRSGLGAIAGPGRCRRRIGALVAAALLGLPAVPTAAEEPLFEELSKRMRHESIRFGVLVQVVGDFQSDRDLPGENGFSVANLRASVGGRLDEGFRYFAQATLTASPALLDARISYGPSPRWQIDAGAFKSPFSGEALVSAAGIDFVNRSRIVSELAPGRQIGVAIRGELDSGLGAAAGVFNGNGVRANGNEDGDFLTVGRVELRRVSGGRRIHLGASAAFAEEGGPATGPAATFEGRRLLGGADARIEVGKVLVSAEVVAARLDPDLGRDREPLGYHVTGGYMTSTTTQVLVRLDALDPDTGPDSHDLVLGFNLWPTQATELQVNALFPTEENSIDRAQVLVNFQVGF